MQRLESAKISESAEQSADNVKFRVIEPPIVPFKPSGPERAILNTMVLLAALGAGLGLAVLLAQLRPTFTTRDLLQKVTGVPVSAPSPRRCRSRPAVVPAPGGHGRRGGQLAGRRFPAEPDLDQSAARRAARGHGLRNRYA